MNLKRSCLSSSFQVLLIAAVAAAAPADRSIGVCTRKDEFAKRQAALDPLVAELSAEENDSKAKRLVKKLGSAADKDIECLMRYREAALRPVFEEVAKDGKKWFTRTRALYALKMLGDRAAVPVGVECLSDRDSMVREAAATMLGHLGGEEAKAALAARREVEKDPYVLATVDASVRLAGSEKRPYDEFPGGKEWRETLVGPEGAKRVEWAWVVKGEKLFNDYDARTLDYPEATKFVYPIQRYDEDLFAGYPRNSFGAGGTHAGEDCAWFREGCSIYAIADGIVRMVQGAGGDWGFLVTIEHRRPDGSYLTSVYGHMGFDVLVRAGDVVKSGQKIGTQGLSTAVENGGYGSHLHFGLGDGPFRRPAGLAAGDEVNVDLGDGKQGKAPVLRLVYAKEKKNRYGFPLTAFVVRRADGTEATVEVPEQPTANELGWFQAYVKDCRGWRNPQKLLPELVGD